MKRRGASRGMWSTLRRGIIVSIAQSLLLASGGTLAHAATFTVNSTADAVDTNPGNGVCADGSGHCTLRAAIMEANALPGTDTITLPAGTYVLTIPGINEDAAAKGDLDITANLTINGAGAATTIVDGAHLDRVLHVLSGTVTISGVTIQNGSAAADSGGGIYTQGTLNVLKSAVNANAALISGGIFALGALTLTESTVSGNTSTVYGALYLQVAAIITNSTISGNTTGGAGGSAIYNLGTLALTSSTIEGNIGGSPALAVQGPINMKNTIVANNSGSNCNGPVTSLGHNLDSGGSCFLSGPGDLNNANPLLGPLALNAPGTTRTLALLVGSPAIDAGDNVGCPTTDQRGVARPQGAACDIGAYEAISMPTPTRTATPTRTPTRTATIVKSEIGGIKFNDLNGNGMYEPQLGEPGLAGWTINLVFGTPPNVIDLQATTDASGNYHFTGLAPGTYHVSETLLPGWTQTFPALPGTYTVTVPPSVTTINFGNKVAPTPTLTPTRTPTFTATKTRTFTPTRTPTRTPTSPPTLTATRTFAPTSSPTRTPTKMLAPTSTATPTAAPCASPPPCMVSWWPLNETGGTLIDDIWFNNLDGTSMDASGTPAPVGSGGPTSVVGQHVGNSLYFPGEYVEANYSQLDFGTGAFSIDAWVKVNGVPNPSPTPGGPASETIQPIVDKTSQIGGIATGYALFLHYASSQPFQLGFVMDDGVGGATTALLHPAPILGGWYHVAATVARPSLSQAVVTLYVDGLPSPSVTLTVGSTTNAAPLWIGKSRLHGLLNSPYFQEGTIDELEIFNCALAPPDIQQIYNAQQSGKCTPTPGATPTPTSTRIPCGGDCDGDGQVTVNELITMVNIALGSTPLSRCIDGDASGDGQITIDEVLAAVNNALNGCPCGFVGPRMCGGPCPNLTDVCQPLPNDAGCVCRPGGPIPTATATTARTATPTFTERATAMPSGTPTRTVTPAGMPTTCVPTPGGMIAWWKLDEPAGAGTVVDIGLPPANNGVPRPGPLVGPPDVPQAVPGNLVTNPPDGALFFDVPTTYVEVLLASPDLDLANSDLTIDAWTRPTEVHPILPGVVDVVEPLVDKLGSGNTKGYALYLQITGTCLTCPPAPHAPPAGTVQDVEMHLVFAVGNGISTSFYPSNSIYTGTFTVGAVPPLSKPWPDWMHLAVEVDRTNNMGTFYLNGSHLDSLDPIGNPGVSFSPVTGVDDSSASFLIGGTRLFPTPIGFHGEIEINELEVFNVPLSPADIQSIAASPGGKCNDTSPLATATATSPRPPTPTATRSSTPSLTPTRPVDFVTRTPTRTSSPTSTFTRTPTRTSTPSFTPRTVTSTPTATPPCEEGRSLLVSTGNASIGGDDPLWSLTGAPVGIANFPPARPAIVIGAYGGWSTLPGTQWITADSVCGHTTGCPAGTYEYELCWQQCGELVDVAPFMALADNRANVFLDNTFLIAVPGFSVPTSFSFNAGPGPHSLRVDVVNDLFSGVQTPTGMDLSGVLTGQIQITPCPVRPPTFTATPSATPSPTATAPTRTRTVTATFTATRAATPTATAATSTPTPSGFAEICVLKFNDVNGNGMQDAGEPGLSGWNIEITDLVGNVVAFITTGAGGTFCTGVPAPVTYTVFEVPQAGWTQTFPAAPGVHTVTVVPGPVLNLAFGNQQTMNTPLPTLSFTRTPTKTPNVPPPG